MVYIIYYVEDNSGSNDVKLFKLGMPEEGSRAVRKGLRENKAHMQSHMCSQFCIQEIQGSC